MSMSMSSNNIESSTYDNNHDETKFTEEELRSKLKEYIHFIDHVLQPELEKAVSKREEVELDIQEYKELRLNIENFIRKRDDTRTKSETKTKQMALVDLGGCQMVYCNATIDNPNKIFIKDDGIDIDTDTRDVGSNNESNYVQLTLDESLPFIDIKIKHLETHILPKYVEKAKTVAGHIEESLILLETMGKEMQIKQK